MIHVNLVKTTINTAKQHADPHRHFTRIEGWNCYLAMQKVLQYQLYCFTVLAVKRFTQGVVNNILYS
jgi:hypothetical protein